MLADAAEIMQKCLSQHEDRKGPEAPKVVLSDDDAALNNSHSAPSGRQESNHQTLNGVCFHVGVCQQQMGRKCVSLRGNDVTVDHLMSFRVRS